MSKSKHAIRSDLKRLDAHVIQPHEYDDAPELTDQQLAEADVHQARKLIRRGRPPSPHKKVPVKLRIDPDVLTYYRASGPGWQTRINEILRYAAKGSRHAEGEGRRHANEEINPSSSGRTQRALS